MTSLSAYLLMLPFSCYASKKEKKKMEKKYLWQEALSNEAKLSCLKCDLWQNVSVFPIPFAFPHLNAAPARRAQLI